MFTRKITLPVYARLQRKARSEAQRNEDLQRKAGPCRGGFECPTYKFSFL